MKVELTYRCNTKETHMVISGAFVTTKPYVNVTDPDFILYMRAGIGEISVLFDNEDNFLDQLDDTIEIDDPVLFGFHDIDQMILSSQIVTTYGALGEIRKRVIHLEINYEEHLMVCKEIPIPTDCKTIFNMLKEAFYQAFAQYKFQINMGLPISDVESQMLKINMQAYSELMYCQSLLELENSTFYVRRNALSFTNDQINQVYKDVIYDEFHKILVDVKNKESRVYLTIKVNDNRIHQSRFATYEDAKNAFDEFSRGLNAIGCYTVKINDHRHRNHYRIFTKDSISDSYVMDAFITTKLL